MKQLNWQTKALTLFIAAAALWLASACANEPLGIERITPSAPCGPDVPLTPSIEFITLEGAKVPSGYERDLEAAKNPGLIGIKDQEGRGMFIQSMRAIARAERLRPETERIETILNRYEDRIWKQYTNNGGHIHGYGVMSMRNENGKITDKQVIEIEVIDYVDQRTLPPEVRIPECIEGVEVHFVVAPIATIEWPHSGR